MAKVDEGMVSIYDRPLGDGLPIGLVENLNGISFSCSSCVFIEDGVCMNPEPRLYGQMVTEHMCCNRYFHEGMRVIIS